MMQAVPSSLSVKKPGFAQAVINSQDKMNWIANVLFLRQDFDDCLKIVEVMLTESDGKHEFGNYMKALIFRIKGRIHESLELFKKCHMLDPSNADYLKQFGRSLYLLGRHKTAIEVFDECLNMSDGDWEVFFYRGLSCKFLRIYDEAI